MKTKTEHALPSSHAVANGIRITFEFCAISIENAGDYVHNLNALDHIQNAAEALARAEKTCANFWEQAHMTPPKIRRDWEETCEQLAAKIGPYRTPKQWDLIVRKLLRAK